MPLADLTIKPGIIRNGTAYNSRGSWYDANLVRWHDGALRPIGGWQRRVDELGTQIPPLVNNQAIETIRDSIAFRDNDNSLRITFGSNLHVYEVNSAGSVADITPSAFFGGPNNVTLDIGYGTSLYGLGAYGTPRSQSGAAPLPVKRWSFDNWGEDLLASFDGGTLYTSTQGSQLTPISGAPLSIKDFVVTDERIVMALVATGGPRRVVWSDREDNTEWAPTISNYAGGKNLSGSGDLIGVYKLNSQYLILGENDAHIASYINAPFVYGFRKVGENCGPVTKDAVVVTDRIAVWLGARNFWLYDGTLRHLPCPIMDHINDTIDPVQVSKMVAHTVSDFSELWWLYQSKDGSDIDSYIVFNYVQNHWSYGKLDRTAAVDKGATASPIMVCCNGIVWNHEQEGVIPDGEVFALTGPLLLKNGNTNMAVRYMFPDTGAKDQVQFEFLSRQHSTDVLYSHGVFDYDDPISTTGVLGKEVFLKVIGLTQNWKFGVPRFDIDDLGGGYR